MSEAAEIVSRAIDRGEVHPAPPLNPARIPAGRNRPRRVAVKAFTRAQRELAERIKRLVCDEFAISLAELESRQSRANRYSIPRIVAMGLAQELLPPPVILLSPHFAGRCHSSIFHTRDRLEELQEVDRPLKERVGRILAGLRQD